MQTSSTKSITKNDIKKIKDYIATAQSLPRSIADIEKQLQAKNTGIVGLEPFDIVELNHKVINNANSWGDIEYAMKRVGGSLAAFSEDLENFGQEIIDAITTMPGYLNYLGTISTLTEDEINSLPPLEIGKTEKNRFGSIQESLVFIADSIDEKKLNSQDVILRLQYFKAELNNIVAPGIGSKMKLANNNEINRQITDLNLAIDKAQARLDEKIREAEPNFFEHFLAFISPYPRGVYQTLELFEIKNIAPLREQRDQLVEQVKQKDILAGTLLQLHTDLDSLLIYVDGAIQSTSQLETVWVSISEYINSSKNKVMGMHDFLTLRSFVSSLRVVLKNWKTIQTNSNALIAAFN
ncbi:alpha-xenorhabdolysin family binary toxin subunit A [Pseudomonas sp. Tul1A2]